MIINALLIPHIQSIGAAIGTLIAEFTVCVYQCYRVRKEIPVSQYARQGLPLLFSGIIMYLIITHISLDLFVMLSLFIKVIIGAVI